MSIFIIVTNISITFSKIYIKSCFISSSNDCSNLDNDYMINNNNNN